MVTAVSPKRMFERFDLDNLLKCIINEAERANNEAFGDEPGDWYWDGQVEEEIIKRIREFI